MANFFLLLGLPDLANKNMECPFKCEFQGNEKDEYSMSISMSHAIFGTYLH